MTHGRKTEMENKLNGMSFGVRNIDPDEWNVFKFYAGREGKFANEKMLELIEEYNNQERAK